MEEVKRKKIYYADLNPVSGSEQGGYRPVLVLQNDTGNKYSPTTIVAAITSKREKNRLPTHVAINNAGLDKHSIVLLEQVRTIDKNRLVKYVGEASKEIMDKVDKAVAISLDIPYAEAKKEDGESSGK